jgi:tetratricopeptide (TPR) repeat protein
MRCPSCGHINITHFGFCEVCLSILDLSPDVRDALQGDGAFAEERITPAPTDGPHAGRVRKALPWLPKNEPEAFVHEAIVIDLAERFHRAANEGRCERVVITGDSGMGKTRLVREFLTAINAEPKYVFAADGHDDGVGPLSLFRGLLKSRYGISPDLDPIAAAEALHQEIVALHEAEDPVRDAHLIGHLVGLTIRSSPYLVVASDELEGVRHRAMQALTRLLVRDARQRPLLLIIDEFHLASSESRHVISHLHRSLQGHPVWFILLGRQESWAQNPELEKAEKFVHLQPLKPRAMEGLLLSLCRGVGHVPDDFVARVTKTVRGNPFAAYHVLLYLYEMDVITRDGDRWEIDETAFFDLAIPTSLAGVAAARYQTLSDQEKLLLARAAVVGRRFRLGQIVSLGRAASPAGRPGGAKGPVPDDVGQTRTMLDGLVRKAFLKGIEERRIVGEERYQFTSQVDQELVLESIAPDVRKPMHLTIAQWYDVHLPAESNSRDELIANHCELAGEYRLAAQHALLAGRAAADRYLNHDAIQLLERARRLVAPLRSNHLLEINHDLGNLYMRVGEPEQALERLEEMLDHAWRLRSRAKGAVALDKLSRVYRDLGKYPDALKLSLHSLDLFRQVRDRRGMASACDDVAQTFWLLGDFQRALGYFQQDIRIRKELNDHRGLAVGLLNVAKVYIDRGDFERALRHMRKARELFRAVNDPVGGIGATNLEAAIALYQGDAESAERLMTEALVEARSIGERVWEAKLLSNIAEVVSQRDPEQAELIAREARTMAVQLSDKRVVVDASYTMSRLFGNKGKWDEALKTAREGLAIARDSGLRLFIALGQVSVARLLLGKSEASTGGNGKKRGLVNQEALKVYAAAADTLRTMGAKWHLLSALEEMANLFEQEKRDEEAAKVRQEISEIREKLGPTEATEINPKAG